MRVLLVEPSYRKGAEKVAAQFRLGYELKTANANAKIDDESLWYPPLGLMKLARYHKNRGDEVHFVIGCDKTVLPSGENFGNQVLWDRVYITSLFTFHFDSIVQTIKFYKESVGGTQSKIFVGGIMSTLMVQDIFDETGIYPIPGVLTSARQIRMDDDTNIDLLMPDYDILAGLPYAIKNTYYAYTSRGCINRCAWCGVPKIEPCFVPYIDIKPVILETRSKYGDKAKLKLMDNNVLASPNLKDIVDDLLDLGYGRNAFTNTQPKRQRVIDFNQGLDASFINKDILALLSKLNIKPLRIAFDRISEKDSYTIAVRQAIAAGFMEISNYMLYNFLDTPSDLYQRLVINIRLNEESSLMDNRVFGKIYCYPMRYAPIDEKDGSHFNRHRDLFKETPVETIDWLKEPVWTRRFVRNIEIMKSAAHGAISPTSELAWRTIGSTFEEYIANLYMPEELLRNRNKHEKRVYDFEPKRKPGTGKIEKFREFIMRLLESQDDRFQFFHNAVTPNLASVVRTYLTLCTDKEMKKWLELYVHQK